MDQTKLEVTGDCFEANGKMLLNLKEVMPDALLVHAEVAGQGPLEGVRFAHAFVQWRGRVYDNTNGMGVCMDADAYRALGKIDEIGNFHAYTVDEAIERMFDHDHYGPWELKTSTGL